MDELERKEWQRIAFMVDRDGIPAALAFSRQGLGLYLSAIRVAESGGNQYGNAFRESLLASVRVYQQYLERNEPPETPGGSVVWRN